MCVNYGCSLWRGMRGTTSRISSNRVGITNCNIACIIPTGSYSLRIYLRPKLATEHGQTYMVLCGNVSAIVRISYDRIAPGCPLILEASGEKTMEVARVVCPLKGPEYVTPFKEHTICVTPVAFSPDGRYIVSGSWNHSVRLWDAKTGKGVFAFKGHTLFVRTIAFSSAGNFVSSCPER